MTSPLASIAVLLLVTALAARVAVMIHDKRWPGRAPRAPFTLEPAWKAGAVRNVNGVFLDGLIEAVSAKGYYRLPKDVRRLRYAPDLVTVVRGRLKEGVWHVRILGHDCLCYLWGRELTDALDLSTGTWRKSEWWHGLIVAVEDKESVKHARRRYLDRADFL